MFEIFFHVVRPTLEHFHKRAGLFSEVIDRPGRYEEVPIIGTGVSGGAGEPPPCAPTEPYLKVSLHTALVVEPFSSGNPSSNVQIALIGNDVFGAPIHRLLPGFPALVCACGQSIWQGVDPPVAPLDTVLNGRSDRSRPPNHAPLD